jgi:hypothetical protein
MNALGGPLIVKFATYVCEMTMFKGDIKELSNLFFTTLLLLI